MITVSCSKFRADNPDFPRPDIRPWNWFTRPACVATVGAHTAAFPDHELSKAIPTTDEVCHVDDLRRRWPAQHGQRPRALGVRIALISRLFPTGRSTTASPQPRCGPAISASISCSTAIAMDSAWLTFCASGQRSLAIQEPIVRQSMKTGTQVRNRFGAPT